MTGAGAVRIELLGEIRVVVHGSVTELRSATQRRLLARLALAGGEVVPTARLIDLLWPDGAPATAATSLRNHVARLRAQVLGVVEHRPGGYAIVTDLAIVDLAELERALDAAEGPNTGEPDRETCERVLALDRGELCPEFSDEPFVLARARRLSERVLAVKVRHVRALMAAGDLDAACAGAMDLIGHHDDHEAAQVTAMQVLARAGRAPEALRVGGAFRRRLREQTGLPPSAAFVDAERTVFDAVNAHDLAPPPGVLPTFTNAIIGRGRELDTLGAAIGPGRLCTVVGPGGVGKTRVAVEAAGRVADAFDAVCFVDLSTADSAHAATELVARAVGVGDSARSVLDRITLALRARSVLLVLDNCDQVVAGVRGLLGALHPRCGDLGVIVTSREALRLADEQCVAVGPLDPVAAVELFRSTRRRRGGGQDDGATIAAIVDLVDRLPLAIELAAADTEHLTLVELRAALTAQPLRPATPAGRVDRHSSIDRTIEWSWALLTAEERRALTRLALFVGPWDALDAAAVCDDADLAPTALSVVTALVRKSLVTADLDGDVGRYRMPLTIRAFAHEKLRSSTDRTAAHRRLLGHLGEHLATAADLLYGPGERQANQWRERALPTLRSALGWALSSGETDAAMDCLPQLLLAAGQLAIGFDQLPGADRHANAPYLVAAAALRESRPSELHRLTADPALRRTTPRHEAFVHVTAARVLTTAGAPADEHHHRLSELAAAHDDPLLAFLAASAHWFEDPFGGAAAMQWRHRALAAAVRLGAPSLVALCQYELIKGRFDPEAVAEYRRLLEVCRSHGNVQAAALCQMAIDYATPAPDTFVRLTHQTARAVDANPHFFRYFAHHRAALLADFGRPASAAIIAGALASVSEAGALVVELSPTTVLDAAIAAHGDAFAAGRLLDVESAARFVVDELRLLCRDYGVGDPISPVS